MEGSLRIFEYASYKNLKNFKQFQPGYIRQKVQLTVNVKYKQGTKVYPVDVVLVSVVEQRFFENPKKFYNTESFTLDGNYVKFCL